MARAKQEIDTGAALYERDFSLWLERQAQLLRERRLDELDVPNLLEEIEDARR